jgi:hypothetical protein
MVEEKSYQPLLEKKAGVPQWGVHTKYTTDWEYIGNYNY